MKYIIMKKRSDRAGAPWVAAETAGQEYSSYDSALGYAKALIDERSNKDYKFMICQMQVEITKTNININDMRTTTGLSVSSRPYHWM